MLDRETCGLIIGGVMLNDFAVTYDTGGSVGVPFPTVVQDILTYEDENLLLVNIFKKSWSLDTRRFTMYIY